MQNYIFCFRMKEFNTQKCNSEIIFLQYTLLCQKHCLFGYTFVTEKQKNMKKLVYTNATYQIWQLGKESLHTLAEFVVKENYKHHTGSLSSEHICNEIEAVYQEELLYADNSQIFMVYDKGGKVIGSIRVFKWDRKQILPIQKIFGVNPLKVIHSEAEYNYWHIGRFAIDSFAGISTITLFKQLMVYAVHPIVYDDKSYMIAETDTKLLKVMNALGIETTRLGDSMYYLASETIPVCSSKQGLSSFYAHYRKLCQAS